MASHGYPPGLGVGFHQEHASSRVPDVRFMFESSSFCFYFNFMFSILCLCVCVCVLTTVLG